MHFPILQSVWRLVRYHLGSVAFGSFIIALIQFIRIIMKYLEKRSKKWGAAGKAMVPLLKCIQCCLWCFEKCMKFLNKNAYIEIGEFCRALTP